MTIAPFRNICVLIAVLLVGRLSTVAEVAMPGRAVISQEQQLLVNYGIFPSDNPELARLEIFYQVYNYALAFMPEEGVFTAEYSISAKIFDDDKQPAESYFKEKRVTVASLAKTKSASDYRINQLNFDLPPGKYRVEFVLRAVGSNAVVRRDFEVKLKQYDSNAPSLSSIELVQAASPTREGDAAAGFSKGSLTVIPSLSETFAADDQGRLLFYLEIHRGGDSTESVVVETKVRGDSRGMVYRDSLTTTLGSVITRQLREISLKDFAPDDYELIVSLHGRRYKKVDEQKSKFRVPWTQLATLKYNFDAALDQLAYVFEGKEIKPLRELKTVEERRQGLDEFWAARDPDPTTAVNELKVVFYHRLDAANRLFSVMHLEGWRSDRGRVYIQHGEPDQIDDYPFSAGLYPYQEWHYYRSGRYRKFVFVDADEDGDYRLQYPYDGLNLRPDF